MPSPEFSQNFVKPQSGGTGGWMAKLFGGIADDRRARQMAQIQFDLHQAKAGVETEHQIARAKGRVAAETAGKDYLGERGFSRERRRAKMYKKEGLDLRDVTESSADRIVFQKKGQTYGKNSLTEVAIEDDTTTPTTTNNPEGGTNGNKTETPRKRGARVKDVESALSLAGSKKKLGKNATLSSTYQINGKTVTEKPGTAPRLGIDSEAGASMSTGYAAKLGRNAAAENVNNGGGGNGGSVTPPKVKKPRTPKAGA